MIRAEILADSVSPQADRLTTFKITFPRYILAEFNTHRAFSRNSASSRAIPFSKMVKLVQENPFIPLAFQANHKGMQGTQYLDQDHQERYCPNTWLRARDAAIKEATFLNTNNNVTKQLCNRLLEPFMWHTVIITSSEPGLRNFFELRCPQYKDHKGRTFMTRMECLNAQKALVKAEMMSYSELEWLKINEGQADIHIMQLAECMRSCYLTNVVKTLKEGEYHIPFGDNMDHEVLGNLVDKMFSVQPSSVGWHEERIQELKIKVAIARCARISYQTLGDNPEINYEKDIKLYDRLLQSKHASPFEHVAEPGEGGVYYANFKGWKNHRKLLEEKGLL